MAIEIFNVSFTLSRDNSNDDDETWVDAVKLAKNRIEAFHRHQLEEHIANEIRSWLEDIDYGVTDIKINNTTFITVDWANADVNAVKENQ